MAGGARLHEAVLDLGRRRAEGEVVDVARLRVRAPPHDALHDDLVRHVDEQEDVGADVALLDRLGLRRRARVPVEEPASALHVRLAETVHDHVDDNVIRHEVTRVHETLGLLARRRALRDLLSKQIAHRDVHEAVLHGTRGPSHAVLWRSCARQPSVSAARQYGRRSREAVSIAGRRNEAG